MDPQGSFETKEEVPKQKPINYTGLIPVFLLLVVVIARISYELYKSKRQKTRNPQERRMYAGSRARPSFNQPEPTIYVSPNNLPPPPKYEFMAPPSYEEVVGVHYPQYQVQPIATPIATAMAQQSTDNSHSNASCSATVQNETPATVVTVSTNERRTSVTVATSS